MSPIIFCHYGNSDYLPYVLQMAAEKNPDKTVYLLGDHSNKWLGEKFRIEHRFFEDYSTGQEIELFDSVYQLVSGNKHRHIRDGVDWVKFVFKRWFYVFNFINAENINSFWHFDSDNLILDSLSRHESKLNQYECTEQCEGACMNGFIASKDVLSSYLNHINALFQDEEYLGALRMEFTGDDSCYAFTEMAAYVDFKNKFHPSTFRLNSFFNDESFDDCLCHQHGMSMEYYPPLKRQVKKIYFNQGMAYAVHEETSSAVRMISLNMSWLPIDFYRVVVENTSEKSQPWILHSSENTLAAICYEIYRENYISNEISAIYKKYKKLRKLMKKKRRRIKYNLMKLFSDH